MTETSIPPMRVSVDKRAWFSEFPACVELPGDCGLIEPQVLCFYPRYDAAVHIMASAIVFHDGRGQRLHVMRELDEAEAQAMSWKQWMDAIVELFGQVSAP